MRACFFVDQIINSDQINMEYRVKINNGDNRFSCCLSL